MKITYTNKKVEKYFTDFAKLQKKLQFAWVRSIKKHLNNLEAAECFGDFLRLGLGKPELLSGYSQARYSLHIAPNVRLIIEPITKEGDLTKCTEVEIKGVSDYHGDKENWYIP